MVSLSDCAYLVRENVDPTTINEVPYIGLQHIGQGTLHLLEYGSSKDVNSTKAKFKKGDILFGKLRPYFRKVIKAPFDGVCSTDIWVVRAKEGFCQDYIFYWMADQKFIDHSMAGSEGTKMPRAKWEHVIQFQRSDVPLPTQERIADILGTLDDKIELNQQMNHTLEAMARAIYKSWFVDFDPVYAKMEGINYPLPAEVIDLFPDELIESELGLIPEGWEVKPFGDLLSYHLGGDWGKESRQGDFNIPARIIRGTDIPSLHEGGIGDVPLRYIKKSSFHKRVLQHGDIIIEISGGSKGQPTGRSLFVTQSLIDRFDKPICPTSFCRLFRPRSFHISVLLNIHMRMIYDQGKTWNYQHQSTGISNFQTKYFLANELVIVPSDEVLDVFSYYVAPMLIKMQMNESIVLEKIRDILLPALMNGEI